MATTQTTTDAKTDLGTVSQPSTQHGRGDSSPGTPLTESSLYEYLAEHIHDTPVDVDQVIMIFEFSFHQLPETAKLEMQYKYEQTVHVDPIEFFINEYIVYYRGQNLHPPAISMSEEIKDVVGIPVIGGMTVASYKAGIAVGMLLKSFVGLFRLN